MQKGLLPTVIFFTQSDTCITSLLGHQFDTFDENLKVICRIFFIISIFETSLHADFGERVKCSEIRKKILLKQIANKNAKIVQ